MITKSHNDAIFDTALCLAVSDVFAGHGLPLERLGPSPALSLASLDVVGVIGFSGPEVRGTLVIAAAISVVTRTYPATDLSNLPLRDRVRDWMGELCNLTLGRIKVELARYGQGLGLSTPVAFTGEHVRLGAVQRSRTRAWDFTCSEGKVRAWIEVDASPSLQLELAEDPATSLTAGDLVLF